MATTVSVQFKAIEPGPLKYKQMVSPLTTAVFRVGRRMLSDYKKTVATWKVKPVFELTSRRSLEAAAVQVMTTNRIYGFLDQGTSVRYATMSSNWESKSRVRVIGSYPGAGRRIGISRWHPQRGIAAREWSIVIENKYRTQFAEAVDEAMHKARIASGHAI